MSSSAKKDEKLVSLPRSHRETRKSLDPEVHEQYMISLAMSLAEKRLMEGTASSQEVIHFLRLGSRREKLERQILMSQLELLGAKTEAIRSAKDTEEMYRMALEAMKRYGAGS